MLLKIIRSNPQDPDLQIKAIGLLPAHAEDPEAIILRVRDEVKEAKVKRACSDWLKRQRGLPVDD